MPYRVRVQIDLARHPSAILCAAASASGVSENTFAKDLLETSLLAMSVLVEPQAEAEGVLMRWVEQAAAQLRAADTWDEHVTLTIFDRIREEIMPAYKIATAGRRHKVRINRAIGRLVRTTLGAVTRRRGTALERVQLPSNSHLIVSYTCLFRDEPPPHGITRITIA
jgi:hypothetical protein